MNKGFMLLAQVFVRDGNRPVIVGACAKLFMTKLSELRGI